MPGVTKEQIQAAREADLFTYLQFHEPGVLKQDGPNFRHKEHDSLVYVTGKR
ncbi:topoisomerase, partial [Enterococcus durans]|nr:topoisomerase [Enterococcus durans]